MIGKAQLLNVLEPSSACRLAADLATPVPGGLARPRAGREAKAAIMMMSNVSTVDVASLLTDAELIGAAKALGYPAFLTGRVGVDELRQMISGHFRNVRHLEPSSFGSRLVARVVQLAQHLDSVNCTVRLEMGPPANEGEVASLEQRYGVRVPEPLRGLFTDVSGCLRFVWDPAVSPLESPTQLEVEDDMEELLTGRLGWNLPELSRLRRSDFESVGGQRVLPCFYDGTGDYASLGEDGRVVWWCHDDYPEHGEVLSDSVDAFLDCWERHCWLTLSQRVIESWVAADRRSAAGRCRDLLRLPPDLLGSGRLGGGGGDGSQGR